MSWSDKLQLPHLLRDVRVVSGATVADEPAPRPPAPPKAEVLLREQLERQRAEMDELQRGVLKALRGAVPQVVQATETTLLNLALEVANRLVASLPISTEMVEAVVREAMVQAQETAELWIDLHPDDLDLLQRTTSPLLTAEPGGPKLHFQTSPGVTRGGCVIHTRFGVLDARRETKLELLRENLLR